MKSFVKSVLAGSIPQSGVPAPAPPGTQVSMTSSLAGLIQNTEAGKLIWGSGGVTCAAVPDHNAAQVDRGQHVAALLCREHDLLGEGWHEDPCGADTCSIQWPLLRGMTRGSYHAVRSEIEGVSTLTAVALAGC